MAESVIQLEKEYCPPIDSALFSAILSDYENLHEQAIQEIRSILDALKASALEEEATDFDPSGSRGINASETQETESGISDRAESCPEHGGDAGSKSETDLTSLSRSLSSFNFKAGQTSDSEGEQDVSNGDILKLEELDSQSKEALLKEMFPNVKEFSISYTLKKCDEIFSRTVEELLNQVFLEDENRDGKKIGAKGIEAFAEANGATRGRKVKGKRKKRYNMLGERRASSLPAPVADQDMNGGVGSGKWEKAQRDVEFICSRTSLPLQVVSSTYHNDGASLPATIHTLLESQSKDIPQITSDDPIVQAHAFELGEDFPTIPASQLTTLVRLSHPSTAAAHELAKELITRPQRKGPSGIEIITRYSPIELSEISKRSNPHSSSSPNTNLSLPSATALASSYNLARQTAFTQASAAYRRGKSDHLMGAAAGYYSSIGRDFDAKAKNYSAAAADALVSSQSNRMELDLHGVSVKDAVRIARERVTMWWVALGDSRIGGGSSSIRAFRIVTGLGRHSEGGRGRIGPAVGKMLVREGWKVQVGEGVVTVTGIAKVR
ncbi:MAG: hypothetical protein M1827_007731 [Pycnora praestabilis]|nr:MAG: hypothetical protein M1827_007731 [Pycnora praestabilis]